MAIIEMSKVSLVAHRSERSKILRALMKVGCVETVKTEEIENTRYKVYATQREEIESKLLKISFALTFLKEMANEAKRTDKTVSAVSLKKENVLISLENYEDIAKEEYDIFNNISDLEVINNIFVDLKSEKQRILVMKEQLNIYEPLELKFSEISDTTNTAMLVGTMPTAKAEQFKIDYENELFIKIYPSDKISLIAVVCHKEDESKIRSVLASLDFIKTAHEYDATAKQKLDELSARLDEIEETRVRLVKEALDEMQYINRFKILYDYYFLELKKIDVMGECSSSKRTFVLEGWIPKEKIEEIETLIGKVCKYAEVVFRDAYDNEIPPTLTKNNSFVDPFESITNMYGAPSPKELDPNFFVAVFFFIIFGFMFSDAGYGIVLAVSCFAYYFIKKPVKKSGRMILLFGLGGISTIIWGAIFGGWFGMSFPKEPLVNPLDPTGSLIMFGLALGIGVLQLSVGFAMNGINKIRSKKVLEGIFADFSWVVIFAALGMIVAGMLAKVSILTSIGKYTAIGGAAALLIGGAIGKKGPIKMIGGAFGQAYGSINIISDLLSYSRLFGLGLTTGVIGFVVNQFAIVIVGFFPANIAVIGWIVAVPVLLVGHLFNFAINLLGVYVHNSRLQYIEFFGRFYEAAGHTFAPLGSVTKYTYLDN